MYHRNIFESSSKVFGHLREFSKFTKNVRERSSGLRNNFGKSSEIFGKSSKTPSSVSLHNKQNNAWTLGDMEFIFLCSYSISHSFAVLTRSISIWTLEDKFHISATMYYSLCLIRNECYSFQKKVATVHVLLEHFYPFWVFRRKSDKVISMS